MRLTLTDHIREYMDTVWTLKLFDESPCHVETLPYLSVSLLVCDSSDVVSGGEVQTLIDFPFPVYNEQRYRGPELCSRLGVYPRSFDKTFTIPSVY